MTSVANNCYPPVSNLHKKTNHWPFCVDTTNKLKKVALGSFAAVVSFPIFQFVGRKIVDIMRMFNIELSQAQEVFQIWDYVWGLPSKFLRFVLKTTLLGYIVILGPIVEEWLFRGKLYSLMKKLVNNPDTTLNKIIRIIGNGLFFGASHLSPYQGWTNIPVFLVTFLYGCTSATLRESTGDITASTSAHILNNGITMFFVLKGM